MAEDITDIVTLLSEFYSLSDIDVWLDAPQMLLGGKSANRLLAEGKRDQVLAVIHQLRDSAYT